MVVVFSHQLFAGPLANAQTLVQRATQSVAVAPATKTMGRTASESPPPSWPRTRRPEPDAPNVLVILTDDVGFGASSTFGGPIATPTFDALARAGLRYNRFHTTAICSPTRASLLTGRNPHNVGFGNVTNLATGYPGYTNVLPKSAATVAQLLRGAGYATAMFGKAHITPEWEMSRAGPFDRWPTGLGFDYYYGFLGADTSQFEPNLVENTSPIDAPRELPDGAPYHLDADLANRAIAWIETQHALAPQRPVFIYYATGSPHAPNHAPREWLERFRGRFDAGWDVIRRETYVRQKALGAIPRDAALTPRPAALPAWDSLPSERRRVYARFMEAYAASLAYADAQIGRVIESLRRTGRYENTLILYVQGDNGASTEGRLHGRYYEQSGVNNLDEDAGYVRERLDALGGPSSYPLLTGGWGWALNSPFPWAKRVASHLGGTRNGLVISWPRRIRDAGGLRAQFHHVSDLTPTILEAAKVEPPASFEGVPQQPIDGISMSYSFDAAAAAPERRQQQIFEIFENMGWYEDGWMLSSTPVGTPWDTAPAGRVPLAQRRWELYDLTRDFSQSRDLAAREPQRLAAMQARFWEEAARNQLLPIHPPSEGTEGRPSLASGRRIFEYASGITDIPENAAPPTMRRAFSLRADISVDERGMNGVLAAIGGRFGGWSFYVHEGRPAFHYNAIDPRRYTIRSNEKLSPGKHTLRARFVPDSSAAGAPGTVTLWIGDRAVGSGRVDQTLTTWISHTEGFDIGVDRITAVAPDYEAATSRFGGQLERLVVELE